MNLLKIKNEDLCRPSLNEYQQMPKAPIFLVLDNIRSMHNIGSIFRTADAFSIQKIFLCGITATPPHREIQKTALGATDSVAWEYYDSSLKALEELKKQEVIIYAVEQTKQSIPLDQLTIASKQKYALVFGNEVEGVSQEVIDFCGQSIEIPQFGTKHSFNVSVSAGIVLWQFYKLLS